MADAAILLDADPALIRKAQAIGLRELTANLAGTTSLEDQRGNKPVTEAPKKLCCLAANHGRLPLASGARSGDANSELLHPRLQRRPFQAQTRGGPFRTGHYPVRLLQCGNDLLPFGLLQRRTQVLM